MQSFRRGSNPPGDQGYGRQVVEAEAHKELLDSGMWRSIQVQAKSALKPACTKWWSAMGPLVASAAKKRHATLQ